MIQLNLLYANGAAVKTSTISVAELISMLQAIPNPATTAVLIVDPGMGGRAPVQADGYFQDPMISAPFFQLTPAEI